MEWILSTPVRAACTLLDAPHLFFHPRPPASHPSLLQRTHHMWNRFYQNSSQCRLHAPGVTTLASHPRLPRPMLNYCSKSMFYGIDLLNSTQRRLHAPRVTTIALDTPRHHCPILHYCSKRTASGIDLISFFQSRRHAPRIATQTLVTSGRHRPSLHSQLTPNAAANANPVE